MNVIHLYRAGDVWMAREAGDRAPLVRELFGTDSLPTIYGASCHADSVQRAIAQLNPDASVLVLCQRCDEPIVRAQSDLPSEYHAGCRPGAGRIPYRLPERFNAGDPFDLGTNGERDEWR